MESSELLKRLIEAVSKKRDDVPEGWFTADQWAAKWKMSRQHSQRLLNIGVKKGITESKVFRTVNSESNANKVYPVRHYREIK